MRYWSRNLRYSVRAIRGRPLQSGLVVLTFALGIGLNTSLLSTASQLLLRPLPYPAADRLVVPWPGHAVAADVVGSLREDVTAFADVAIFWDQASAEYFDPAAPGAATVGYRVALVSLNYLDLFGMDPFLGRGLIEADIPPREAPGGIGGVILTHEAWTELFGADPNVLGRPVGDGPYTTRIVGVMPPEATPLARGLDGWTPAGRVDQLAAIPRAMFEIFGRLDRSITIEQAAAELETRRRRAAAERDQPVIAQWTARPAFGPTTAPLEERTVVPLRDYLAGNTREGLVLLAAAGLAILLVALVNASALGLDRSLERRHEAALRRALGAESRDLLSLVLAERGLLALLGGAVALVVAGGGAGVIRAALPPGLPLDLLSAVGTHAVGWALASSVLCAAVSTLIAAAPFVAGETGRVLTVNRRGGGRATRTTRRTLGVLLTVQLALITILMVGTGMLLRTVGELRSVDTGFSSNEVVVLTPQADGLWQKQPESSRGEVLQSYFERLTREISALPFVEAVGQGTPPLASPVDFLFEITAEGRAVQPGNPDLGAAWRYVGTGDYFAALGVELVRGRSLDPDDVPEPGVGPSVALVNEAFADGLWPDEDPVGRRFQAALGPNTAQLVRVKGVVRSYRAVALDEPPGPMFFTRSPSSRTGSTPVLVRIRGEPAEHLSRLEEAFRAADPRVPLLSAEPLSKIESESIRGRRAALTILGSLACVGLVLGLLGIYGVASLNAGRRSREIGIRKALGARGGSILGTVLGREAAWVLGGLLLGLLGAASVTPLLEKMLFGVGTTDPLTFVIVPALLLGTALLGALLPGIRAMMLDPSETLREE